MRTTHSLPTRRMPRATYNKRMGRPTIPVRGEVQPINRIQLNPLNGNMTVTALIREGPSRLEGREAEIEIPVEIISRMSSRQRAIDAMVMHTGAVEGRVPVLVYADQEGREAFHVHSVDCKVNHQYEELPVWKIGVDTREDIVTSIYSPHVFDYSPDDHYKLMAFAEEVRIHVCLSGLE